MFHRFTGVNRHNACHTHGAKQEGNGFQFKRAPVDQTVKQHQQPLAKHDSSEAEDHIRAVFAAVYQQKSQSAHGLQHSQKQHVGNAIDQGARPGTQLGQLCLLTGGDGLKLHIHTAHGDGVSFSYCADLFSPAVDKDAALGGGIGNRPASVVVPGQNRVVPGHSGKIDHQITLLAAADHVFPMGHRQSVFAHLQPGPDLWLPAEGQQGFCTPEENNENQQRCCIAQDADIHMGKGLICGFKGLQNCLHAAPSFCKIGS